MIEALSELGRSVARHDCKMILDFSGCIKSNISCKSSWTDLDVTETLVDKDLTASVAACDSFTRDWSREAEITEDKTNNKIEECCNEQESDTFRTTLDTTKTKILMRKINEFCEEGKDQQVNIQDQASLKLKCILEDFKDQIKKELSSELTELNGRIKTKMVETEINSKERNVEMLKDNKEQVEGMKEEIISMQKKAEEDIRIEFKREIEKLRKELLIQRNCLKDEEHIQKTEKECGCSKLKGTSADTESDEGMGSKDCLVFSEGDNTDTGERKRPRKLGKC